jgi:alanine racemase
MRITRAEVDLSAIRHNVKQVASRVGTGVRILGVVKANAYGHGLISTSKAMLEAGVSYFGVALPEEGIQLRQHTNVPILVFSPPAYVGNLIDHAILESYLRFDLEATISSLETAYALNAVARTVGKKAKVQIKVDTGMGRVGFFARDTLEVIRTISDLDSISIVGVYSHFATSDEMNKGFARYQLSLFKNVVDGVESLEFFRKDPKGVLFHIANSGAILDMPETYFDMVRPGIILYGYYPSMETSESMTLSPALSLKSSVIQVKRFPAGMSISYGRKYFTRRDTAIAVVPIGYGDGYTRLLSGKALVLIKGKKYPVVGTITMDYLMVDVGEDSDVRPGDEVVLIGRSGKNSITAWDIASSLGTIPYEVLCAINERVPRVYINCADEQF